MYWINNRLYYIYKNNMMYGIKNHCNLLLKCLKHVNIMTKQYKNRIKF